MATLDAPNGVDGIDAALVREHASWLRALARRLVGAPAHEDVAQDALLSAVEAAPRDGRPLRPWLARVVRNAARMRHRADRRRARREDATAAAQPAEAHAASVELVEAHRALCAHVLALAEPFRATILAHYFEGHTLAEIARRDGVAEGTVRWRHARALERLRAALEDAHGQRAGWATALAPLIHGPTHGPTPASLIVGGLVMNKLAIGIAVAAVAAAAGGWWWRAAAQDVRGAARPSATPSPTATSASAGAAPSAATAALQGAPPRHTIRLPGGAEARRRLAEQIAAAQTRRAARANPPAPSGAASASPAASSAMASPEDVLARMQEALGEVKDHVTACVTGAAPPVRGFDADLMLTGDPDVGTLIDASALVGSDGAPLPAAIDDCVRAVMLELALPPIALGNGFKVHYVFTFDEGDGPGEPAPPGAAREAPRHAP